ncbi:MAG: hypothetical protein NVV82_13415 [Sporocytophaga sp.]|nr:hypothetical protein [Sporocytophaga sp.]
MKSSLEHPLVDEVHVDEFEIGTPKKGEQGRSVSEEKVRVVIAIEHRRELPEEDMHKSLRIIPVAH